MYEKVDSALNFVQKEQKVLEFWRANRIFAKRTASGASGNKPIFTFYDGPPTANGVPHMGHVLTRAMKDLIPRHRAMKGYNVAAKAGWDTHGLPVELEVEKQLGINGKAQIEAYGIGEFVKKCKESVWKYKSRWEELSERVGFWADMENPYITYDNDYIESEWWAIKQINDKNLLYLGHKIVPYCPRCGTALSSHEVAQGYKDVKEKSVVVRFAVANAQNTYFLAWTTTPWTLPSNLALCVNPNEDYATVEAADGNRYILAKALVEKHFAPETYKIAKTCKGATLERAEYTPLFSYQREQNAYYVTCDAFVTLTDGTGIVHIAPAFGEDDSNIGRKYSLPLVQMVGADGRFDERAGELSGKFCIDANKLIIADLTARGLLFSELLFEHSYPFCWRCDTPLIYYARKSWFIKMTEVRERLLAANAQTNWLPPAIGTGRMGNFLENVVDWAVSRERYWGTPLPVWICGKCGEKVVVGSRKELSQLSGCPENIELHRPEIDAVTIKCKCGGVMHRTPEVCDCWFDSGSMPYAQFHYPFENKELFEQNFPADFISEAVDQTRGWFYTLLAVSTLLFDTTSYKNCLVLGLVGDRFGVKMSKHKGNGVDPWDALGKQGADAIRWYFYTSSQPYLPSRYYDEAVGEAMRKFLGTLWNTYAFFVLYAEIDKFDPSKHELEKCKLTLMDKFILSRLTSLAHFVDESLMRYEVTEAARAVEDFTDVLSNWYVRRCRERFWGGGFSADKEAAFTTLYTCLTTLIKVAAPFVPFVTETIYQNLVPAFFPNAPESVHLCAFPAPDKKYIDKELEKGMGLALDVVNLGRNCRNAAAIKNRQPLSAIYVAAKDAEKILPGAFAEIICGELNVKRLEFATSAAEYLTYEIKPQLKTLGPKYGAALAEIREYLSRADADAVSKIIQDTNNGSAHKITLKNGVAVELSEPDLLISPKSRAGFSAAGAGGVTVALDTLVTPELAEEGLLRELVSKIQTMRKDADFSVTDRIRLQIVAGAEILDVVKKFEPELKADTLCAELEFSEGAAAQEWDINGHSVKIAVQVVKK